MLDSPVWDTWFSYAVKLRAGKEIGQEEENKLVVSVLREYFHNDDYLKEWLIAARNPKGEEFATILAAAREPSLAMVRQREELARMRRKRFGENGDDEAPATSRQRHDDGQ